jgi:hypothetical protein
MVGASHAVAGTSKAARAATDHPAKSQGGAGKLKRMPANAANASAKARRVERILKFCIYLC